MAKSPDAFRTISEVADWLGVQAHVLRFWESKFSQVKPVKRAGGRRYYRPADMLLLGGIKKLLHDDGMTIKGTQKLLREKGVPFVADLSQPLDDLTMAVIEDDNQPDMGTDESDDSATETAAPVVAETDERDQPGEQETHSPEENTGSAPADPGLAGAEMPDDDLPPQVASTDPETPVDDVVETSPAPAPMPEPAAEKPDVAEQPAAKIDEPAPALTADSATGDPSVQITEPVEVAPEAPAAPQEAPQADDMPEADEEPTLKVEETRATESAEAEPELKVKEVPESATERSENAAAPVPSFRARVRTPETSENETGAEDTPELDLEPAEGSKTTEPAKPRVVDVPPVPPLSEIEVSPSVLTALSRLRQLSPEHAREIKPHLARLTRLRASMANPRKDAPKD